MFWSLNCYGQGIGVGGYYVQVLSCPVNTLPSKREKGFCHRILVVVSDTGTLSQRKQETQDLTVVVIFRYVLDKLPTSLTT